MKKILMIGPFLGQINGMTIANQTLYEGLKENYFVEKINSQKIIKFENKVQQGKFNFGKFFKIILNLIDDFNIINKGCFNIVYMTPGQSFLGFMRFSPYILLCKIKKNDVYIHIHGSKFSDMYEELYIFQKKIIDLMLKNISGVIVLGERIKEKYIEILPNLKYIICANGVQDEYVATLEEIENKKNKTIEKVKILYLSNLMEDKGILDLLEASRYLEEEKYEINLAGNIEPNLKKIVMDYLREFPKKIIYHGVVKGNYKKKLLLSSDIFILPSKDEGQPISILEAYANGCAVITDDNVGGIGDIYRNNINGVACKINDNISILNAIEKIEYKKFINFNYETYRAQYKKSDYVDRIINIIEKRD